MWSLKHSNVLECNCQSLWWWHRQPLFECFCKYFVVLQALTIYQDFWYSFWSSWKVFLDKRREENQLDATECFIAIKICSTCFGHSYAHHQELETILVLLPHMVCNVLVVGGRLLGVEQQAMRPGWGKLCDLPIIKFYANPTNGSRADACEETGWRAAVTKLIGPFRYLCESLIISRAFD